MLTALFCAILILIIKMIIASKGPTLQSFYEKNLFTAPRTDSITSSSSGIYSMLFLVNNARHVNAYQLSFLTELK